MDKYGIPRGRRGFGAGLNPYLPPRPPVGFTQSR